MLFFSVVCFLFGRLISGSCFDSTNSPCKSCSVSEYSPSFPIFSSEVASISDCQLKPSSSVEIERWLVVTSEVSCQPCASLSKINKVYSSIIQALAEENKLINQNTASSLKFFLHGKAAHYILKKDLIDVGFNTTTPYFFRRQKVKIDIKPLFCSDFPQIPNCLNEKEISTIVIKSVQFRIYVSSFMSLSNVLIYGTDAQVKTDQSCKNSMNTTCCAEEEIKKTPLQSPLCGLNSKQIFHSQEEIASMGALINVEMIVETGELPAIAIANVGFKNFYLSEDFGFASLIDIKQFPANISLTFISIEDAFFLKGLVCYDPDLSKTDPLYKNFKITSDLQAKIDQHINKTLISIDNLIINRYNVLLIFNREGGSLALFDLSYFQYGIILKNLLIKDLVSNHLQQSILSLVNNIQASMINATFSSLTNSPVIYALSVAYINLENLVLSNCSFRYQNFLTILNTKALVRYLKYNDGDSTGSGDSYSFIRVSQNSDVEFSFLDLINLKHADINIAQSTAIINKGNFLSLNCKSFCILTTNSDLDIIGISFMQITADLFAFSFKMGNSSFINCYVDTLTAVSAIDAFNAYNHYIENSIFTNIRFMNSFWSPSRIFLNWTVYNSIFKNSIFERFVSYYVDSGFSNTMSFINMTIDNVNVTKYTMDCCCTKIILKNCLFKRNFMQIDTGRAILTWDDGLYYVINGVFEDTGFEGYPAKNPTLWNAPWRVLIATWGNTHFYLSDVKVLLGEGITVAGGVFTCNLAESNTISGLFVKVFRKLKETPTKAFNLNIVKKITITKSTFINLGCADNTFNLPFTIGQSASSFINYPYEGGETLNTFQLNFTENSYENCSCERAGPLAVINFNYITIANCTFNGTAAFDRGGAIFIVSTNELFLENCTFLNAEAKTGSFVYLSEVLWMVLLNSVFKHGQSYGSSGFFAKRVNVLHFHRNSVEDSSAISNGGFFSIEETNINVSFCNFSSVSAGMLGGLFYAPYGVNLNLSFINIYNLSSQSGGLFFFYESKNIMINDVSVRLVTSLSFSSTIHIASFSLFDARRFSIINALSPGRGTVYLATLKENSRATFAGFLCEGNTATEGACLFYESSEEIQISNSVVSNCQGDSILDFRSVSLARITIQNITMNKCSFSFGLLFSIANLTLKTMRLENNKVLQASLGLQSCHISLLDVFINQPNNDKDTLSYFLDSRSSSGLLKQVNIIGGKGTRSSLLLKAKLSYLSLESVSATLLGDAKYRTGLVDVEESQLSIKLTDFSNNTGFIIKLVRSNLSASDSNFSNNENPLGNDIVSQNSDMFIGFVLIDNCNFARLFGGVAIEFINLQKAFLKGVKISQNNSVELNSSGIKANNIRNLTIFDTVIENMRSFGEGGALRIYSLDGIKEVHIKSSTFSNNIAQQGGAIFMQGNTSFLAENCHFFANRALNLEKNPAKRNLGRGGGLALLCDTRIDQRCRAELHKINFENNFAEAYAPAIFSVDSLLLDQVTFNKDNFETSNATSSGPVCLSLLTNSLKDGDILSCNLESESIKVLSGQTFNASFALIDNEGFVLKYDKGSTAKLYFLDKSDQSANVIMEKYTSVAVEGIIKFENVVLKSIPGSQFSLSLLVTRISDSSSSESNTFFVNNLEVPVKVVSTQCLRGYIKNIDMSCSPCPATTYSIIDPMLTKKDVSLQSCQICPENAECKGLSDMTPLPGFWRMHENSTLIIRCPIKEACLGNGISIPTELEDITGACAVGHYGNLCYDCIEGYGKFSKGELCKSCTVGVAWLVIRCIIIGCVVIIFVIMNINIFTRMNDRKKGVNFISLLMKILVNHFHQIGTVTFMESIWVLPSLENFIALQNFLTLLNQDFLNVECLLNSSQYDKATVYMYKVISSILFPLILSFVCAIIWMVSLVYLIYKKGKPQENLEKFIKKLLIGLTISVYLFYPLIIMSCFSLLNCTDLENYQNDKTYLYLAPNMECWTERHNRYILGLILPGITVFSIIFPLGLYQVLRLSKKYGAIVPVKLDLKVELAYETKKGIFRKVINVIFEEELFKFFYDGYKNEYFFWELLIFFKKFVLTLLSSLNQMIEPRVKNILILLFLFLNFSFNWNCMPYKDRSVNKLELLSLLTTFLTTAFLVFLSATLDIDNKKTFAALIILVNSIFILYLAKLAIGYIYTKTRSVKIGNAVQDKIKN